MLSLLLSQPLMRPKKYEELKPRPDIKQGCAELLLSLLLAAAVAPEEASDASSRVLSAGQASRGLAVFGDNFNDLLHKPTFQNDGLQRHYMPKISGRSSQAHLP